MKYDIQRRKPKADTLPIEQAIVWDAHFNERKLVIQRNPQYVNVCGFSKNADTTIRVEGFGVNFHAPELRILADIFNELARDLEEDR